MCGKGVASTLQISKRQEEESDIYNNRINVFSNFISSMSLLIRKVLKDESD
ncbi:hypothetical protein ACJIZ3_004668 [Penstemon smallii]|uniref:Uncharacterized protein n=1 Tax=Penstemon smallii TaxID=265156 RepID=A0ABD3S2S1_9LAMI